MKDEQRNLNPTPEARLAMAMWSHEYAHEQRGGSMDFWDRIGPSRQRIVRDVLQAVAQAAIAHGRTLDDLAQGARS